MTLSLAIIDRQDGTGATATITGSDPDSTNKLYVCSVTGHLGPHGFQMVGSRAGDGTIAVDIRKGAYWWYFSSELAGGSILSPMVYQMVTDGRAAVLTRCIDAIVAKLKVRTFAGIDGSRIFSVIDLNETSYGYPACIVFRSPFVPPNEIGGNNLRDDIAHAINVAFCVTDGLTANSPSDKYDLWRQQAERTLRNQRLDGVPEILYCAVEPDRILDPSPPLYAKIVSSLLVRPVSREPRGLDV